MIRTLLIAVCATAALAFAAEKKELHVKGSAQWVDTGIDLKPGDTVIVEGKGGLRYSTAAGQIIGPNGIPRTWRDLLQTFPLNDAGRGALIGRIGDRAGARPFLIGSKYDAR
ncbi:MAG TPA: hypothetical protein VE621_10970, partial [Bryobacteraceae bacterium]|nr:hypothetical protein [Bryobacteraceae bacterium]